MSRPATPPPRGFRRFERWLVGLAMGVVAFVLERLVMRSVRKGEKGTRADPTTLTSKGGEVDLPEQR